MKIYPIRTKVKISDIDGVIKQVLIEDGVSYKISFWDGRTYRSDWFFEEEFTTETKKVQIGFK